MKTLVLLVACLGVVVWALPDRGLEGQTVVVAWDCYPTQAGPPCYAERLHVEAVTWRGWWVVTDEQDHEWRINPARAVGYVVDAQGLTTTTSTANQVLLGFGVTLLGIALVFGWLGWHAR